MSYNKLETEIQKATEQQESNEIPNDPDGLANYIEEQLALYNNVDKCKRKQRMLLREIINKNIDYVNKLYGFKCYSHLK